MLLQALVVDAGRVVCMVQLVAEIAAVSLVVGRVAYTAEVLLHCHVSS